MMAIPSDEFLLAAFARGDRAAFDWLAARYSGALDGFFRRRLPDDSRVEELRQERLLATPTAIELTLVGREEKPATDRP